MNDIRHKDIFVKNNPERREVLDTMGFVWDELAFRWEQEVLPALTMYKDIQGNMRVPRAFAVPSESPWPREVWGMKLGKTVHHIRNREDFVENNPERREVLNTMGFLWKSIV